MKIKILSLLVTTIGLVACNETGSVASGQALQSTASLENSITGKCVLKGGIDTISDDLPSKLAKGATYQAHIKLTCKNKTIYDVTDDTKFEVNNPGVVSIDKSGVLTAKVKGNTEITYSYNAGDKVLRKISVTDPQITGLTLYSTHENLYAGNSVQLHVAANFGDGTYTDDLDPQILHWKSSNTGVAIVSNGKVELIKKGFVTIEVSDGNNHSAQLDLTIGDAILHDIEITPVQINVDKIVNDLQQIGAVAKYSDNSRDDIDKDALTCSSSDEKVVKFSKNTNCLLEVSPNAKASDSADITVSYKDKSQTKRIIVGDGNITSLKIGVDTENLFPGVSPRAYTITATSGKASYEVTDNLILTSSDPSVIMVKDGQIHALKAGVATISVLFDTADGKVIKAEKAITVGSIEINSPDALPKGTEASIEVKSIDEKGMIHDRTHEAKITSSNDNVVMINSDKQLVAKNIGVAQINVTLPDGSKATKSITVDAASLKSILLVNVPDSIKLGYTASLGVLGTYSDGSELEVADKKSITWSVTPSQIATISQDGVLKPTRIGVVKVTANYSGLEASNSANVDAAEVVNLDVGASEVQLMEDEQFYPKVKVTFSDSSSLNPRMNDVTCDVGDKNDNIRVYGSQCLIYAFRAPSTSSVIMSYHGFTKTIPVKVLKGELPPVKNITLDIDRNNFMIGQSRQYKLTFISNLSQEYDVTNRLKLISSDEKVLKVVNINGVNTLQALSDGYVKLSTIYDGKTYDFGYVTVNKDAVVNVNIALYDDANKLADNQHLMPHMEYTIKVTGCTTNTGRILPSSECSLSLDETPSGAAANLTGMKFTPLLAGDVVLHDNKYNYDYKYHTDAIRNPHYEMSAGSFSKPFTKIILTDAGSGYGNDIVNYDNGNHQDMIYRQLNLEGRYFVYQGHRYVSGGGAHWEDIFFAETNRPITLSYMFTGASSKFCDIENGVWFDGARFTAAPFNSVSVTNIKYPSRCYMTFDRSPSSASSRSVQSYNGDALQVQ